MTYCSFQPHKDGFRCEHCGYEHDKVAYRKCRGKGTENPTSSVAPEDWPCIYRSASPFVMIRQKCSRPRLVAVFDCELYTVCSMHSVRLPEDLGRTRDCLTCESRVKPSVSPETA